MIKKKRSSDVPDNQTGSATLRGRKLWLYVLLSLVAALLLWFTLGRNNEPKDLRTHLKILAERKDPRAPNLQVWFTSNFQKPQLPDGKLDTDALAWIATEWSQVKLRLALYHEDSLRQLASIFDRSIPGAITGHLSSRPHFSWVYDKDNPISEADSRARLKVIFYGIQQLQASSAGALVHYEPESNAIFVPAYVGFNRVVMDAMYFHELVHVRQGRQATAFGGKLPATLDRKFRSTDIGADMEIEAQDVGRQVFNIGTKGEYGRRISKFVVLNGNITDPIKLILSTTAGDFDWIDEALNAPAAAEPGYRRAQYVYDLGRECIVTHTPERDRRVKVREFYHALNLTSQ